MASKKADVFVSRDNSKDGDQWWAEVVVEFNDGDEEVLYATGFCETAEVAEKEAEDWMKKNKVAVRRN